MENDILIKFGQKIRQLRKAKNLSQEQLAELTGYCCSVLCYWRLAVLVCRILSVPVVWWSRLGFWSHLGQVRVVFQC